MFICEDCGLEFEKPVNTGLAPRVCPSPHCGCTSIHEMVPVEEAQEGKSLDELAGEGHIATPDEETLTPEQQKGKDFLDAIRRFGFKIGCFGMRGDIEHVKSKVKNLIGHPEIIGKLEDFTSPTNYKKLEGMSEAQQNIILAYRHLEDARMRLGKAVQAFDGGKSCYPR